ncbi:capsular biosynthesis protein [Shinella daejeonensis]|uniref:capsule biosynthesis protein n=1 Tax=Shinella daejeonensis TaxID=659017 RepID=UPI0020C801EF|nr:capsular biosynthesis protein [Shinella daejeonensis]MCP8895596.1 capsular biosynthesis protein [Shinella daejeonensis]
MSAAGTEAGAAAKRRVFLFLQGPSSPIFMKCAERLEAAGHICLRINLNAGDRIFWRRPGATGYRGRSENWPAFVRAFMEKNGVSDLILLGEERPCHKAATAAARALAIPVYVVEMGYLRPDWVTFERDGMSSNSHFPRNPEEILALADGLPEPDGTARYRQTFLAEAAYDLLYNLPNVFLWFLYPHYKRHALFHPLAEYAGWLRRLARRRKTNARVEVVTRRLLGAQARFFVYPLQLQTDYQIRAHSPFSGQEEAIRLVLDSFSRHARSDHQLLVKLHPLDNGLIDWNGLVRETAERLGLAERIHVIDGGDLHSLTAAAIGMVTVNSTSALSAFRLAKPVKTLGSAVFDTPGLSYPGTLNAFWNDPLPPDPALVSAFFRVMAAHYQVRGNFYSRAGTDAAAQAITDRLLAGGPWSGRKAV